MPFPPRLPTLLAMGALILGTGASASAQYAERRSLAGSGQKDVDTSGRSVKNKRVRAVHSDDPDDAGSSAYFIRKDPFLAYQLGRNLNFREFRDRDGVFERPGEPAGRADARRHDGQDHGQQPDQLCRLP